MNNNKTNNDFQNRLKQAQKQEQLLYKKYKIDRKIIIHFPQQKDNSIFIRLALWILNKKGGVLDIQYSNIKH